MHEHTACKATNVRERPLIGNTCRRRRNDANAMQMCSTVTTASATNTVCKVFIVFVLQRNVVRYTSDEYFFRALGWCSDRNVNRTSVVDVRGVGAAAPSWCALGAFEIRCQCPPDILIFGIFLPHPSNHRATSSTLWTIVILMYNTETSHNYDVNFQIFKIAVPHPTLPSHPQKKQKTKKCPVGINFWKLR